MESKQLKEILEQDKLWVESKEKEGRQAYLHGADLSDADLENAKQAQIVLRDREYKETLKEKIATVIDAWDNLDCPDSARAIKRYMNDNEFYRKVNSMFVIVQQ